MQEISPEELKILQLKILDTVSQFCEKNGIKYWLDFGTLLGSVRHKGFIPWDDDIDIGMPRADYERFASIFNEQNKRYQLSCVDNNSNHSMAFAKVLDTTTVLYEPKKRFNATKLCVNIDVFIYDNVPNDKKIIKGWLRKEYFLMRLTNLRDSNSLFSISSLKKPVRFLIKLTLGSILRVFPKDYFAKKQNQNAQKYKDEPSDLIGYLCGHTQHLCSAEAFRELIEGEFEGKNYKIPKNYDIWLKTYYGDYMTLPPPEKQVSNHRFQAFFL